MGEKIRLAKKMFKNFKILGRTRNQLFLIWFVRIFFGLTFFSGFVPFSPEMPSIGLDPSWKLGVNQVVSQKLNFGTDITFTFGPYASVYTGMYHPSTNELMMLGSILIATCYLIMFYFLSKQNKPIWLFLFSMAFAFAFIIDDVFNVKDVILFSYPLLFSLLIYQISNPSKNHYEIRTSKSLCLLILMVLFSFGILPFIKGTMVIVFVFVFLCALFLWFNNRKLLGIITIVLPIISMIFFWTLAGQKLAALPNYFSNINRIISGYTDAMSLQGITNDIIIFVISASFILVAIIVEKTFFSKNKIFLLIVYAIFIFTGYKAGFVRHDIHALIVAETILFAGLFLILFIKNKFIISVMLLAIVSWFAISINYRVVNIIDLPAQFPLLYTNAIRGIWLRINNSEKMSDIYEEKLLEIRKKTKMNSFSGTTDIYNYNQSILIASENCWSPRPVFQSYAAYNPYLLDLNNLYLHSVNAPDNILFRMETIDERFPALDDALSWPTIITFYCVKDEVGPYIHFQKRVPNFSNYINKDQNETILFKYLKLGDSIDIPYHQNPLFAQIEINPTFLGKFFSLMLKNSEIRISLVLENGDEKDYRLIPSMIKTPFIISPVIESTDDFLKLSTNEIDDELPFVKSINIYTPEVFYGFSADWFKHLWETTYKIKLSRTNFYGNNNKCQ